MNLTVGDIRFSESGYASATVEVGTGTFPFLLFTLCKMDVSVPLVEGKALEQYKDELLEKARERITKIYKEIVSKHCSKHSISRGNQQYGSFQDAVDAGESKAFKVEHGKIITNAAQVEFISPLSKDNLEEHPNESVELSVNGTTNRSNSPYVIVSVACVDKLNCEILSLNIEVERDDRKGIRHYESVAINKARHIIKRIAIQL
ncbi:hypothetical protein CB343_004816 [Salmonella enterica subsp. diarizonae]|nr:hypothetical protein [Salmonella enterica subsp. diarizonae]